MIIRFWQKINDFGLAKAYSEKEIRQTKALNQLLNLIMVWLVFFLSYSLWAGNYGETLIGTATLAMVLVTYFMIYEEKLNLAKHFLLLNLSIGLTFSVYCGGKGTYAISLYLPALTLIHLLLKREKTIYFYYPYYLCSIILSILLTIYIPSPKFLTNPALFSYAALSLSFLIQFVLLKVFIAEMEEKELLIAQKQINLQEYSFLRNAMFHSNIDGICMFDKHKQMICVNEKFLQMWDISKKAIEKNDLEIILKHLQSKLVAPETFGEKMNLLNFSHPVECFEEIELLDGRFFEVYSQTIQFDERTLVGRAYGFRDISKKKQGEKKLMESEELFRSLYEEMPVGVVLGTHHSDTLSQSNAQFRRMLGYTKEELEQKTVDDITHPDERGIHKENYHKVWRGELELFDMEKKYLKKDKSIVWGHTTVAVARDTFGNVKYDIAMIQDITHKKMAEKKIKALLKELRQKNGELEEKVKERTQSLQNSNQELLRSNYDLEQFAYIASHDLQEPLRTVGNFVQLLDKKYGDNISEEGKEYIQFTVNGVSRMSKLIQNLLQYSRVGRKDIEFKKVDLNKIICLKIQDLMYRIKDSNAELFIYELPQNISCEPNQLAIVFYNLLGNALKFSDKKKTIVALSYQEREQDWLFSVKDNGIGIDNQFKDKIFEIFKRLNGREDFEGTGIGLALCKRIINRHNGKIWFDSKLNHGTTFHFTVSKRLMKSSKYN